MKKTVLLIIIFLLALTACTNTKPPVGITLSSDDSEQYLPGQLRADLVVVEANTAEKLIDTLVDKAKNDTAPKIYEAVLNKLTDKNFYLYYNDCFTDTQYKIRVYQENENKGDYVYYENIDFKKPFLLDVILGFTYDGNRYNLIYSDTQSPFIGFESKVTVEEKEVVIYGNKLLNGKREAKSFVIVGEENMYIQAVNMTFLGEYLPESDDDIVLPVDFFDISKFSISEYLKND